MGILANKNKMILVMDKYLIVLADSFLVLKNMSFVSYQ